MTGPNPGFERNLLWRGAACLAALAVTGLATTARAGCPAPPDASPALAQMDPGERLQFLGGSLERAQRRASFWMWSWRIGYLGLMGGALGLAQVTDDRNQRIDLYFGAGKSAAGTLNQVLMPLHVAQPAAPPRDDLCAALLDSEAALDRAADDEARVYDWRLHAVMVGFNVAIGLAEGFAYDDIWTLATIGIATGVAVGELEIWTQPTDAVEVRRHYRTGDLTPVPAASARARPGLAIAPLGAGLMLTGTF